MQDHGEPDWATLAATGTTLAIYMGMSRIETICAGLAKTLRAETPAAVVQWAGGANERRLVTTLGRLADEAQAAQLGSPAVILVGDAVGEAQACGTAAQRRDLAHAA
jgi:uroporphyrin-III C-methyltransferase